MEKNKHKGNRKSSDKSERYYPLLIKYYSTVQCIKFFIANH